MTKIKMKKKKFALEVLTLFYNQITSKLCFKIEITKCNIISKFQNLNLKHLNLFSEKLLFFYF